MIRVKPGKKGQVSLPLSIPRELRPKRAGATLPMETTANGAVVLRPAADYPIEIYSDLRLREFEVANRLTPGQVARAGKALKRRKR